MQKLKPFGSFINENLDEPLLIKMLETEFPEYRIDLDDYLTRLYIELTDGEGREVADFSLERTPFDGWIEAVTANVKPEFRKKGISTRTFSVINNFVKMCGYKGIYAPPYTNDAGFKRSKLGEFLWTSLENKGLARSEVFNAGSEQERTYYYTG